LSHRRPLRPCSRYARWAVESRLELISSQVTSCPLGPWSAVKISGDLWQANANVDCYAVLAQMKIEGRSIDESGSIAFGRVVGNDCSHALVDDLARVCK